MQTSEEEYEEVQVPGFVSPVNELNNSYEQSRQVQDFDRIMNLSDTAIEDR